MQKTIETHLPHLSQPQLTGRPIAAAPARTPSRPGGTIQRTTDPRPSTASTAWRGVPCHGTPPDRVEEPSPLGPLPRANGAWLAVQVIAHNLARWTARIGLGEQIVTTKTLRRRFFSMAGRLTRSVARRLTLHLPQRWPWEASSSVAPSLDSERCLSPPDGLHVRH